MPLVKPMVGCSPDGWVLFVLGSFDATHNDATILKDCFSRYSDEMSIIHKNDIVLLDRGFRDVNFLTTNKKLHVYCPGLINLIPLKQILKICHQMSLDNRTSFWST